MKAWVLYGINDLQLKEVPMPVPKEGELLVQVKAAGICSSDIQRIFTSGAYHYPIILGHEFSGITKDGVRVAVFPLIPCHTCASCKEKRYETCSHYNYIGSRQNGAFAQYVAVPRWNLIALPENISFEQAALIEPAAVAHHAVKRTELAGIRKAAVIGNGVIGQLIGVWLRHYGIEVVEVLGRNDIHSHTDYHICFEAAGSTDSFKRCIDLAGQNGKVVLVGNPSMDYNFIQKAYWQILRKQLIVFGSWNSSYPSDWKRVIAYANKIQMDSFISHKYEFSQLKQALDMMYKKKEKHSKVMIVL